MSSLTHTLPTPPTAPPSAPSHHPALRRAPARDRILAGLGSLAILTVLLLAATLTPNAAGHGTHTQIGLPPCGFLHATGKPCPTCGMTTAFTHAAHGGYVNAFLTQPGGLIGCLAAAACFWPLAHTAVSGSSAASLCGKLLSPKALWIAAGVWLASWAYAIVTWPAR